MTNLHSTHEHRQSIAADHSTTCPVYDEGAANSACTCHYSDAACERATATTTDKEETMTNRARLHLASKDESTNPVVRNARKLTPASWYRVTVETHGFTLDRVVGDYPTIEEAQEAAEAAIIQGINRVRVTTVTPSPVKVDAYMQAALDREHAEELTRNDIF